VALANCGWGCGAGARDAAALGVVAGGAAAVLVIVFAGAKTVVVTVGAGAFGADSAAVLPHPASARTASASPASRVFLEVLNGLTSFPLRLQYVYIHAE
jgi:hypothetical protein